MEIITNIWYGLWFAFFVPYLLCGLVTIILWHIEAAIEYGWKASSLYVLLAFMLCPFFVFGYFLILISWPLRWEKEDLNYKLVKNMATGLNWEKE